jgi:hypothetical protein
MRRSVRVLIVLGLFGAAFPATTAEIKPGSARWPIKTSVPADLKLDKPGVLVPLSEFLALGPAATHASDDFQEVLYPRVSGAKVREGQLVRTRGFMRVVAGEDDGDYHIQISETNDTFENCLIVEVPKDDADFVKNAPALLEASKGVRSFVMSRITNGQDPNGRIMTIKGPAFVEVTGQLFFDAEHQAAMSKNQFRGKSIGKGADRKQLPSKTSWEIHPITKIVFAPRPK